MQLLLYIWSSGAPRLYRALLIYLNRANVVKWWTMLRNTAGVNRAQSLAGCQNRRTPLLIQYNTYSSMIRGNIMLIYYQYCCTIIVLWRFYDSLVRRLILRFWSDSGWLIGGLTLADSHPRPLQQDRTINITSGKQKTCIPWQGMILVEFSAETHW